MVTEQMIAVVTEIFQVVQRKETLYARCEALYVLYMGKYDHTVECVECRNTRTFTWVLFANMEKVSAINIYYSPKKKYGVGLTAIPRGFSLR